MHNNRCKQAGSSLLILVLLFLMGGMSMTLSARTPDDGDATTPKVTPTMTFMESTSKHTEDADGNWTFTVEPSQYKFGEPGVTLWVDEKDVTTSFDITYSIKGITETATDAIGRTYYKDSTFVSKDGTTGEVTYNGTLTTVLKNNGDVEIGSKVGSLVVVVTAKPKALFVDTYATVEKEYTINIPKYSPTVTFQPSDVKLRVERAVTKEQWQANWRNNPETGSYESWTENKDLYDITFTSNSVSYPTYTVVTQGVVTRDVADYYDVTITKSPETSDIVESTDNKGNTTFSYEKSYKNYLEEELDTARTENASGTSYASITLTYTFKPKAEYQDLYEEFTKEVTVEALPAEKDGEGNYKKLTVTTNLDDFFKMYNDSLNTLANRAALCGLPAGQVDVPSTNKTIFVYKYPYFYNQPNPKTVDSDGNDLTSKVGYFFYIKEDGYGSVGDTEANLGENYKAPRTKSDTDEYAWGTYEETEFDYSPYHQEAGRKTELAVYVKDPGRTTDLQFKTSRPGRNRIGVIAYVLNETDLTAYDKTKLESSEVVKLRSDMNTALYQLGDEITFDIDTKKRIPYLRVTPDPATKPIGVGTEVTFDDNFTVEGYMTNELSTEEAELVYGPDYSTGFLYTIDYPAFMDSAYFDTYKTEAEAFGLDDNYVFAIHNYPQEDAYKPTPFTKSFTYEKTTTDANGNKTTTTVTENVTWMRRYTAKGHQNAKAWSIIFKKAGSWPMTYEIKPWNGAKWDSGPTNAQTYNFTVKEFRPTHIEIIPVENVATTTTGNNFSEPRVRVIDDASGYDVTQYFNLTYAMGTDDATTTTGSKKTNGTAAGTFDADDEITVGSTVGVATVQVKGQRRVRDDFNKAFPDAATTTIDQLVETANTYDNPTQKDYRIHISDQNDDPSKLYEIVQPYADGDDNYDQYGPTETSDHRAGKLHMIGQGKLLSGFTISGVPGLDIQFGEFSDKDAWYFKPADYNTAITKETDYRKLSQDNKNDIKDGAKYNYVVTNSSPAVLNESGIPTSGAFVKFMPYANGFLRLDGQIKLTETYNIVGQNDRTGQVTKHSFRVADWGTGETEDRLGEQISLGFAMIEGNTYYMYCDDPTNFVLHGLWYEPAFVTAESDIQPTTEATVYFNGYAPTLPTLLENPHDKVTFSSNSTDATVNATTGAVQPKKLNVDGVKITGKVTSTEYEAIYKEPSYLLKIFDFPVYKLTSNSLKAKGTLGSDGETYKDSYKFVANPGDTVSTYNYRTGITMMYGGWGSEYKDSKNKAYNDKYEPKYDNEYQVGGKTKFDLTYSRFVDGFSWMTKGNDNAVDEDMNGYKSYNWYNPDNTTWNATKENGRAEKVVPLRTSFSLPRYGTYMRFEPTEPGVLFIYVLQDGVCNDTGARGSDLSSKLKSFAQLKWKPIWIVDESGRPASAVDATSMGTISTYMAKRGESTSQASYTLSLARASYDDSVIGSYMETASDVKSEKNATGCTYDWSDFYKQLTNDGKYTSSYETTRNAITDSWKKTSADTQQEVIQVTSGGYTMVSKAYMRYGISVKAGKTYFIFQNGSKFGLCGFAFLPDGWTPTRDYDPNDPTKDGSANNVKITLSDSKTLAESITAAGGTDKVYGKRATVTLQRGSTTKPGFKKNQWTSICLPFSVSETQFFKVFGKDATVVTYTNVTDNGSTANFTQHGYHMIEAGRPYFVYYTNNDATELVFKDVTLEKEYANPTSTMNGAAATIAIDPTEERLNVKSDGWTFKGTYSTISLPKYSYFLSGGKLAFSSKNVTLKNYRAYLSNDTEAASKAKLGKMGWKDVMSEDKVATNIEKIVTGYTSGNEPDADTAVEGVYTLDGQKVGSKASDAARQPKGVYIVNGKKTVIAK